MSKQVTVNMPNMDDGTLVEVQGLGVFPNGETSDVTDEQYETFVALGGDWPQYSDKLVVEPEAVEVVEPEESTPVVETEGAPEEEDDL